VSAPSFAPVRIVVMEGDGIGPEITAATMNVLAAADRAFGLALSFTPISIGLAALRAEGKTLSERALEAAKSADGVILGPVSHNEYPPVSQGGLNPSGELRKRLDLFANIRPARSRGSFSRALRVPRRPRHRAREHRGLLRRPLDVCRLRRVHADARPRALGAQDHPRGLDPDRGGGICACAPAPQEGDGGP
jgi:hypothetical protein